MCVFCAAIPVAAATGVSLNRKQVDARRELMESRVEDQVEEATAGFGKPDKPIMKITGGVIILLLIGSITYHTLTYSL